MHQPSPRKEAPRAPALHIVPATQPTDVHELLSAKAVSFILVTTILLGALVRFSFVLAADFPLNDGGLFYAMAGDLQSKGYAIPAFTTYNFDGIPFAYPPLAFYVSALLDDLTPLTMFDILRFLPVTVSVATMFAFVLFTRRWRLQSAALCGAVAAFALNPRSFEWMIMGGGLTRSFGMLFAVLTLHEVLRMQERRQTRYVLSAGVLAALTAYSHIEMAWFVAFSTVLLMAANDRSVAGLRRTTCVAALAVVLTMPWWFSVMQAHGISPFIAAMTTGSPSETNPVVAFLVFDATNEPMFALIAALGLLGAALLISRGEWLLPAWVVACGLLDPRGFGNVVCVPLALLAGIAVGEVLAPFFREDGHKRRNMLAAGFFTSLVLYGSLNAMLAAPQVLGALAPEERDAMTWIRDNTPEGSRVLVITDEEWNEDRVSEWFPVLAERRSVGTVQGYEWVRGEFGAQLLAYSEAQACGDKGETCLRAWQRDHDIDFDYVFLSNKTRLTAPGRDAAICCGALRLSMTPERGYEQVFRTGGATIFRVTRASTFTRS